MGGIHADGGSQSFRRIAQTAVSRIGFCFSPSKTGDRSQTHPLRNPRSGGSLMLRVWSLHC